MRIPGQFIRIQWHLMPFLLGAAMLLSGCGESPDQSAGVPLPERVTDPRILQQGERLFQQNCAVCHGDQAQGAEAWQRRNPDGSFPPPPLNGTAHAWHHPLWQLKDTIRYGGEPLGGTMPAFGAQLSESQIDAVIAWFQSLWSDEIYDIWLHNYQARYPTVEAWEAAFDTTWPVGDSTPPAR